MTKAQKAQIRVLLERGALSWPAFNRPTVIKHDPETFAGGKKRPGWFWNAFSGYMPTLGWTSGHSHKREGAIPDDGSRALDVSASQGFGRCVETRLEALQMMRWEMCERFAKDLARIDVEIAKEIAPDDPDTKLLVEALSR